jgi:SAM-dependent methyltransferase
VGSAATAAHWRTAYEEKAPDEVSWFEAEPATSLALIEAASLPRDAAIVDIGGGASRLAAELIARGYEDVTVADISGPALDRGRVVAGPASERIDYVEVDVTEGLGRRFDLWHDRALLHFMVDAGLREAYLDALRAGLRPGGHLVLATFGPEGPTMCSGLPVARYGVDGLSDLLGGEFELRRDETVEHTTPSGKSQQFVYALFRRRG